MSGKKNFSDLKKRIADMLTAQLQVSQPDAAPVQTKAVRLWLADDKDKLLKSFAEVARSEQKMEVDSAANGKSHPYCLVLVNNHGSLIVVVLICSRRQY